MIITASLLGISAIANAILAYKFHQSRITATKDGLTNVYNRRQFDKDYYKTPNRRKSDRNCLILIDVDDFKQINDTKGHAAGDRVLEQLAQYLVNSVRSDDRVYRIGGDEFAVLSHSLHIVRRLKKNNTVCKISVGYAMLDYHDKREMFDEADKMLYDCKKEAKLA